MGIYWDYRDFTIKHGYIWGIILIDLSNTWDSIYIYIARWIGILKQNHTFDEKPL